MADDVRDTSPERPATPHPTGDAPLKPGPRGLPIAVRVALVLAVVVAVGLGIVLLATLTGGGSNGSTTGAAVLLGSTLT